MNFSNVKFIFRRLLFLRNKTRSIGDYKMTIVVRSDISMGKGKVGAQCAHAAIECYRKGSSNPKHQEELESWIFQGQPKIVLRVSSETELRDLEHEAHSAGLITSIIRDAGKTQLKPGTVSVLAIGPGPKLVIDKLTEPLKLL